MKRGEVENEYGEARNEGGEGIEKLSRKMREFKKESESLEERILEIEKGMKETKRKMEQNKKVESIIQEINSFHSSSEKRRESYKSKVCSLLLPFESLVSLFCECVDSLIDSNMSYLNQVSASFHLFSKRSATKNIALLIKETFEKSKSKLVNLVSRIEKMDHSFLSNVPKEKFSKWIQSVQFIDIRSLNHSEKNN